MREGAPKSSKNLQFWCKLLLSLLRLCSHGFSRPLCGPTHTGLRGRIFRSFWNWFQGAKNVRSLLENQLGSLFNSAISTSFAKNADSRKDPVRYRVLHALQRVLLCENSAPGSFYSAELARYSPKKCVTTRVTLRNQCVTAFFIKKEKIFFLF